MVGERARGFLGMAGPGRDRLLGPAGGAAYLAVLLLAAALMLGATGWVLAGGPLALTTPLFAVGVMCRWRRSSGLDADGVSSADPSRRPSASA